MKLDLSDKRKNYTKFSLDDAILKQNPMEIFAEWYKISESEMPESEENAMTLSTVDESGSPHARIVLLKYFSKEGFDFYTNYKSNKGNHIANNPNVCLSFFWESMERQVIINGKAKKLSEKESDDYFYSRPKESRIAAAASEQSKVLYSKTELIERWNKLNESQETIARPEHWGGYRVVPSTIEFWQGGEHRLHDRARFQIDEKGSWAGVRLNP